MYYLLLFKYKRDLFTLHKYYNYHEMIFSDTQTYILSKFDIMHTCII